MQSVLSPMLPLSLLHYPYACPSPGAAFTCSINHQVGTITIQCRPSPSIKMPFMVFLWHPVQEQWPVWALSGLHISLLHIPLMLVNCPVGELPHSWFSGSYWNPGKVSPKSDPSNAFRVSFETQSRQDDIHYILEIREQSNEI